MATTTMTGAKPVPSTMQVALKEALLTGFLVFMLAFLMIGFQTEAQQGQQLSYVTRFAAIFWGIVLVPLGRILIVFNRHGRPMPALIGGGLTFLIPKAAPANRRSPGSSPRRVAWRMR